MFKEERRLTSTYEEIRVRYIKDAWKSHVHKPMLMIRHGGVGCTSNIKTTLKTTWRHVFKELTKSH